MENEARDKAIARHLEEVAALLRGKEPTACDVEGCKSKAAWIGEAEGKPGKRYRVCAAHLHFLKKAEAL